MLQPNLIRPVWKHGPRSLVLVQVIEKLKFLYTGNLDRVYRVMMIVSRAVFLPSKSMNTGTRKMVNYTCAGLSQEKFCWRLEAIMTCKSFAAYKYRGERPIEPSTSWFSLKFPSGQLEKVRSKLHEVKQMIRAHGIAKISVYS